MMLLLLSLVQAEVDVSTRLSNLLSSCDETIHTGGFLQPLDGQLVWSETYGERSSCVQQVLEVFPYPTVPDKHVLVIRVEQSNDTRQVDVQVLPRVALHYFYEPPNLSLQQKLELYLFLGVFHD